MVPKIWALEIKDSFCSKHKNVSPTNFYSSQFFPANILMFINACFTAIKEGRWHVV